MKKHLILFASLFLFVFTSCEENIAEPDLQKASSQEELRQDAISKKDDQESMTLNFKAHLTGDQEVPAADTKATGQAIFKLSKDGTMLHYKLIVANIENVTMAHLHVAPMGANGGAVAGLYTQEGAPKLIEGRTDGILAEGTITEDDLVGRLSGGSLSGLVELMAAGEIYVNIHTLQYRGGEIRGQIK